MRKFPSENKFEAGVRKFRERDVRNSSYKVSMEYLKEKRLNDTERVSEALLTFLYSWHQAFYRYGLPSQKFLTKKLEELKQEGTFECFNSKNSIDELSEKDKKEVQHYFNELYEGLRIDEVRFSPSYTRNPSTAELIEVLKNSELSISKNKFSEISQTLSKEKGINYDKSGNKLSIFIYRAPNSLRKSIEELDSSGINLIRRSPVAAGKALHLLHPTVFPPWDNDIAEEYVGKPKGAETYVEYCREIREFASHVEGFDIVKNWDSTRLKLIDEYNYVSITENLNL